MSHQSGITATDDVVAQFGEVANSDTIRMLKVIIQDEKLVPSTQVNASGTWEEDYDKIILSNISEDEPCYMFYRLDSKNSTGYEFVIISYSPDFAHVRQKMLYASTRSTLKTLFGSSHIKYELFGTVPADVSLAGYNKHVTSVHAPPPLTMNEIEKAEIRANEVGVNISVSSKQSLVPGVSFPITQEAKDALEALKAGKHTYVQLMIDVKDEIIQLCQAGEVAVDDIGKATPDVEPRYHFILFKHSHEGDYQEPLVFVYSCPAYKSSVKHRMLYSSCKAPLMSLVEDQMGLAFVKKLEVAEGSEITQPFLVDALHPTQVVFQQKFARPKRPGKGSRRLIRGATGGNEEEGDDDEAS